MLPLTALMGFLLLSGVTSLQASLALAPDRPVYPVTLTAYNAVPGQTDDTPFETASGAYSNPAVIAARSQDLAEELPFGTIIELDGSNVSQDGTCGYGVVASRIGYRVIEDTMNARYTNRVDVLLDTKADYATTDKGMKNAAQILGICRGIKVRVVGYVDINHIPKTQAELSRIVRGASALAVR